MYPAREIYRLTRKIADVTVFRVNQMARISSENVRRWSKITIARCKSVKRKELAHLRLLTCGSQGYVLVQKPSITNLSLGFVDLEAN